MKTLTVSEAQGCLAELIAQVNGGELVILKSGDQQVTLYPGSVLDLEEDSPELEAELIKGVEGGFTRYSSEEFRARTERIIEKHAKK